ncbi:uncharacterized protein PgNI_02703, partial [Pyricularia grisea]|uniref:Uncharacterized protein n=1 Tax=Pyricularia grisea TaxID=148305 RepID=A0A6P8B8R0_PYRGI
EQTRHKPKASEPAVRNIASPDGMQYAKCLYNRLAKAQAGGQRTDVHLIEASRRECNKISQSYSNLFESYKILWDQNQKLESKLSAASNANTQLRDCISTNETLKAALGFELKESEDENAAVKEWHYQEIKNKDVEIAILKEKLNAMHKQVEQSGMNIATPKV